MSESRGELWLAVAGIFIARNRHIGDDSAVPVLGYPVIPLFFLGSSLYLIIVAYLNRPLESTAAILTVLAGLPCYYFLIKPAQPSTSQ